MRKIIALGAICLGHWSCGAPPEIRWPAAVTGPVTLPLVAVFGGPPPVVEVGLGADAAGAPRRALCALSTTLRAVQVTAALAEALDLRVRGAFTRGRRAAVLPLLELGPLAPRADGTVALDLEPARLEAVPVEVVEAVAFGQLGGTPVSCALGWGLWAEGALDLDPFRGVAHLWPAPPPWAPTGAEAVPLRPVGAAFGLPVRVAGETSEPWRLAVEAARSRLDPEAEVVGVLVGADAEDPERPAAPGPRPAGWLASAAVVDPPVTVALAAGAPPGFEGEAGYDLLAQHRLRFEPADGLLWLAPVPPGRGWLRRHPEVPDCGPRHERCLRGTVERVVPGRVRLRFAAPELALPPRYWAEIDLGTVGRPFPVWVRVDPRAVRPSATIEDPRLGPETVRALGAAVEVVDVLPLEERCHADACVRVP